MSEVRKRKTTSNTVENTENLDDKPSNGQTATKNKISLRIFSRIVVITSLLIVVYFSSKDNTGKHIKPFARQSELLPGKGQIVDCSSSYLKEIDKFEGCLPRECKRYVTDTVVSAREAEELLEIAEKGLKFGGSAGGPSTLDLNSGALSYGKEFVNIYKLPKAKNLFTETDFSLYRAVTEKIKYAVAHHFSVDPNKLYLTAPTFFSRITNKKAVTMNDEYWHRHVDKETYPAFHYTTVLYLNDYYKDFKGGRFVFTEEKLDLTIEPRKARVNMFTSGAENPHYVEKVSSGTRYAMTISFTCDEKLAVKDLGTSKYN